MGPHRCMFSSQVWKDKSRYCCHCLKSGVYCFAREANRWGVAGSGGGCPWGSREMIAITLVAWWQLMCQETREQNTWRHGHQKNTPLESTLGAENNRLRLMPLSCSTAAVADPHSSRILRVKQRLVQICSHIPENPPYATTFQVLGTKWWEGCTPSSLCE